MYRIQIFRFLIVLYIATPQIVKSQSKDSIFNERRFNVKELNLKWKEQIIDVGFKKLYDEVSAKGFTKLSDSTNSLGFAGNQLIADRSVDILFCAYDFISSDKRQACTMIWRKVGNNVYKAYLIFPKGEIDILIALQKSQEWFVDSSNKIQLARSWGRCFKNCVYRECPNYCKSAIRNCTAISGTVATMTGATVMPAALALFLFCTFWGCASCMAICAIGC